MKSKKVLKNIFYFIVIIAIIFIIYFSESPANTKKDMAFHSYIKNIFISILMLCVITIYSPFRKNKK